MAVYDINGTQLSSVFDIDGNELNVAYDIDGNIVFQKDNRPKLKSYRYFYPDDATDTYAISDYRNFSMSADTFLSLMYDDYVANPPEGITVTKRSLGKDSTGQYDIWEYDFNPTNACRAIKLMSGEHVSEITAQFGLAHLIKHIYRVKDNDAFAYIRNYVRVRVVPIFNPWGTTRSPRSYGVYGGEESLSDSSYYSGRIYCGINPERNFTYGGLWENFSYSHDGGTADSPYNHKGDYPFQTAETRILAQWTMDDQENTDFLINCHTGEESNNRDVWIDYMTQTAAKDAILNAVQKNEVAFVNKFNQTPRTEVTGTSYPNETGYGMHGAWNMLCVKSTGFTLEQSPKNTRFGDGNNASAGAINNYASVLSMYILEGLLDKYQNVYDSLHPNDSIPITGISGQNVSMGAEDYSETVALTMTPSDTTQFTFDWVSSDASVCEVWGCTDQAVIVKRGTGTATITVTNKLNPLISTSFTVTVTDS